MLIIEIALGIVGAFFILAFLPEILKGSMLLLGIGLVALLLYLAVPLIKSEVTVLLIVIFGGIFLINDFTKISNDLKNRKLLKPSDGNALFQALESEKKIEELNPRKNDEAV